MATLRTWVEALPSGSPILADLQADGLLTFGTGLAGLHAVSCGTRQPHFAVAGANGLAGRCLSLDMRR